MKTFYSWIGIGAVVLASTAGDVLISYSMKKIGDLEELRRSRGIFAVVRTVLSSGSFLLGFASMATAFFSLLFALSWADLSLVGPASAALTFITNAIAAKLFLKEAVDRRRWAATLLVAGGVVLLAA